MHFFCENIMIWVLYCLNIMSTFTSPWSFARFLMISYKNDFLMSDFPNIEPGITLRTQPVREVTVWNIFMSSVCEEIEGCLLGGSNTASKMLQKQNHFHVANRSEYFRMKSVKNLFCETYDGWQKWSFSHLSISKALWFSSWIRRFRLSIEDVDLKSIDVLFIESWVTNDIFYCRTAVDILNNIGWKLENWKNEKECSTPVQQRIHSYIDV